MQAGITAEDFWQSTPRELSWRVAGHDAVLRLESRRRIEMAWVIATLSRAKTIPTLAKLLGDGGTSTKRKSQTWQDMKAVMKAKTSG